MRKSVSHAYQFSERYSNMSLNVWFVYYTFLVVLQPHSLSAMLHLMLIFTSAVFVNLISSQTCAMPVTLGLAYSVKFLGVTFIA